MDKKPDIYVERVIDGLYIVHTSTRYFLASTFMRLQEYYESPYPEIRGHYFTREEYEDRYAKAMGNMSYYNDWSGFNIPGNVVRAFFDIFRDLNRKETRLYELIHPIIQKHGSAFYLIGANETSVIDHEMAHGFYYLIPKYRESMDALTKKWKWRSGARKWLLKEGYTKEVVIDEIQAYAATTKKGYTAENCPCAALKVPMKDVKEYKQVFELMKLDIAGMIAS